MKIIDLLNKIANDEEIPNKIKVEDLIWKYNYGMEDYWCEEAEKYLMDKYNMMGSLNNEVEILEEEKKLPEKLEDISEIKSVGCKVEINIAGNKTLFDTDTPIVTEHCIYKINQLIKNQKKIIDYLKSKGDE